MALTVKSPHSDWRLLQISPMDVKAVSLDALLTNLWLRILLGNRPWTRSGEGYRTIAELANKIEHQSLAFSGFDEGGIAEAWLRADLVKVRKRNKQSVFSVARPVHEYAVRIRNPREAIDSNASWLVYEMFRHFSPDVLEALKEFITIDIGSEPLDVDSYALALLGDDLSPDVPQRDEPSNLPAPLSTGQVKTFADDMNRLLAYRAVMPRAVLVEHIRRLVGLHLGLYMLRLFRIVVEVEQSSGSPPECPYCAGRSDDQSTCSHSADLIVDFGDDSRSDVARLAADSWEAQDDYMARYIRSHIALKKLDEYRHWIIDQGQDTLEPPTIVDLAAVAKTADRKEFDTFFTIRLQDLAVATNQDSELRRNEYRLLGRSAFRTYVDLLAHYSERSWVRYHRFLLDSLFGKNLADGLLRHPLGGNPRKRRPAMSASLLETLTLIAVVMPREEGFVARPIRVAELVRWLEGRYGLCIANPPDRLSRDAYVTRALATNVDRLKSRLRETGMFVDLSDAFLAQTVRPRYILASR